MENILEALQEVKQLLIEQYKERVNNVYVGETYSEVNYKKAIEIDVQIKELDKVITKLNNSYLYDKRWSK